MTNKKEVLLLLGPILLLQKIHKPISGLELISKSRYFRDYLL